MKGSRRRKATMHGETIYAQLPPSGGIMKIDFACAHMRLQWGEVVWACSEAVDMQKCSNVLKC